MIGAARRRIHPLGHGGDAGGDMVDCYEVQRGVGARGHLGNAPLGNQLERAIDGVEAANAPRVRLAQHDGGPHDGERHIGGAHHRLARRLARLITIGEARAVGHRALRDTPFGQPADIGGGDVQEPRAMRFGQRQRILRALDIDRVIIRLGQIEPDARRAVDHEIDGARRTGLQSQPVLLDVPLVRARHRHKRAVIAAHLRVAMDERVDAMPGFGQTRADFAADQPGGTGDEDVQQQGASATGAAPSACPNGLATPQPGKMP